MTDQPRTATLSEWVMAIRSLINEAEDDGVEFEIDYWIDYWETRCRDNKFVARRVGEGQETVF